MLYFHLHPPKLISLNYKETKKLKNCLNIVNSRMWPLYQSNTLAGITTVCSALFLRTYRLLWWQQQHIVKAAMAPTAFCGAQKHKHIPMRDLESTAQEAQRWVPWETACCFSVQQKYPWLPAADKHLPKSSALLFRQDAGSATVNSSRAFLRLLAN